MVGAAIMPESRSLSCRCANGVQCLVSHLHEKSLDKRWEDERRHPCLRRSFAATTSPSGILAGHIHLRFRTMFWFSQLARCAALHISALQGAYPAVYSV